ncbi:M20/M25/M40 family metallo-hydrolase [Lactobacillus sp. DCY120]|uniref:M20/M25/M40 family metallo-hydrolase n=1 Tax=Bombilactobacillus apium TaxID=2675299 RepID=A0A850R5A6_9LACO|nr:M20/M25/M40 family metallo-hydrolase [Bombilactobacillus apium]NVY95782.1 M20/M25/M40 family metallo-hydrolase [Bombilactobacillus apium]
MVQVDDPLIQESFQNLAAYIALPSVSAKQQAQAETATYLCDLLTDLGAQVQVFSDYQAPLVIAQLTPQDPEKAKTTVLIYNHYDVQPEEPLELWQSDPFKLQQTAEKLIARGASDCKADLISRITALKLYRQKHGDWPCTVKFLLEGEEEVASEHLPEYLAQHGESLQADLVIWESGGKNDREQFSLTAGNKGILCFQITARSAAIDLHSSYAAVADGAAWRLVAALNTLRASDGTIQIPGFFDNVVSPTDQEEGYLKAAQTPDLTEQWGLTQALLKHKSVNDSLVFQPTINIEGLTSGWQGAGVKTITPKEATAKLEFRLVPNQDPEDLFKKLTCYLEDQGFADLQVDYLLGEKGYRSDLSQPIVQSLIQTAQACYGGPEQVEVLPSSAGTGPMEVVSRYAKAPIVSCGVSYAQAGNHAPNENIRIADYVQFINFFGQFLEQL